MGFGSRSPLFGNFSTLCSFAPVMGFLLVLNLVMISFLNMGFAFERFKNVRLLKNKDFFYCHPISQIIIISTTNFSLLSAGAIHSLHTDLL